MKTFIVTILFLILCINSQATECIDKIFQEEKINLCLCQNYSNYNETRTLLYKARTKVLNDYIKDKIINGKLKDKKFEIKISDEILTYHHLEITQGKNGYYISLTGFPTLQQLKSIVDYFMKPDWKPYQTSDYEIVTNAGVDIEIKKFYKRYSTDTTIIHNLLSVWEKDEIRLDYINDSLKYFINNYPLAFEATSSLPIKFKDRYMFFQSNYIFVVKEKEVINTLKIYHPINEDYDIYVYPKWVNICHAGKDNWVYSYFYDKNTFYKSDINTD